MPNPWLYYKICVGEFNGAIDHMVAEVLPDLMASIGASRWFYLRYFDEEDGLHVRLRFQVPAGTEQESRRIVLSEISDALLRIPRLPQGTYAPLVILADIIFPPHRLGVYEAEYEPEIDKYGGGIGLGDAERMFCVSTQIAVETLRLENAGIESRKTMAPCFMAAVLETVPIDSPPAKFLEDYSRRWLPPDLTQSKMLRDEFFDKASELLDDGISVVTPDEALPEGAVKLVGQWRAALVQAAAFYRAHRELGADFAGSQAWQWIHLMNNRLGFSPFEEAYLSTLLEAHYRGATARVS